MRRSRHSTLEEPTINLTPLIDVVFVILIMFIVVAPLLEIERVTLADGPPPTHDSVHPIKEKSPIAIHVLGDNTILYNQHIVSLRELETALSAAKIQMPSIRPQLYHDRKASFGTYQSIKNSVERAGFSDLDVILKPE